MFLQTPPGHLETGDERSQLWPATPTPSGGGTGYGFEVMDRSEHHHGLSGDGALSLQPPARVAHLAAVAQQAAAAAAKVGEKDKEKATKAKALYDEESMIHESMDLANRKGLDDKVLPSKGSSTHGSGKCRPCAWFWKPQGCQNDKECGYCHLCPEGELKNRKKSKVAAMRMGALVPAKNHKSKNYGGARVLKLSPLL